MVVYARSEKRMVVACSAMWAPADGMDEYRRWIGHRRWYRRYGDSANAIASNGEIMTSYHDPASGCASGYAVEYLHYRAKLRETPPSAQPFGITQERGIRERTRIDQAISAIKDEAADEMRRAAVLA